MEGSCEERRADEASEARRVRWLEATRMILNRARSSEGVGARPSASDTTPTSRRTRSAWAQVLQAALSPPEVDDAELYGENELEAVHLIHHGRGGGVYKAWAASEACARELVSRVTRLQEEQLVTNQSLRARRKQHSSKS